MRSKLLIVLGAFVLASCGDVQPESNGNTEQLGIHKNDGKKWKVNPETHEGMMSLKEKIKETPETLDDYHVLAASCDESTDFIISNCSMQGEEHEQLHMVLHPILDAINGLKEASNIEEAEVQFQHLSTNLTSYFEYFEL